ncbi:hypothetical protein ACVWZM_004855 [Bradyrhizobium sp. USDA 4501]
MLPAYNVHGFEFAALDSLQDGLARHPERPHRLAHRQKVVGRFAVEVRLEFIGQPNAPGSALAHGLWPHRRIVDKGALTPLGDRLLVEPVLGG